MLSSLRGQGPWQNPEMPGCCKINWHYNLETEEVFQKHRSTELAATAAQLAYITKPDLTFKQKRAMKHFSSQSWNSIENIYIYIQEEKQQRIHIKLTSCPQPPPPRIYLLMTNSFKKVLEILLLCLLIPIMLFPFI